VLKSIKKEKYQHLINILLYLLDDFGRFLNALILKCQIYKSKNIISKNNFFIFKNKRAIKIKK
jgi:hypothetical protein